jgi:DNA-binding transcriptional MerR regulator
LTTAPPAQDDKFDDEDYPAYTMGRAAEMIGVSQAFLRSIEQAKLFSPARSDGGHRRYSRYQLRLAARVREIADQGTPVEAACRIIMLEDQLHDAVALNQQYERDAKITPGEDPTVPPRIGH